MESKYRIKIAYKLVLGFGIVLIAVLVSNWYIADMLDENKKITNRISEVYNPVSSAMDDMKEIILNSQIAINQIVSDSLNQVSRKNILHIYNVKYPELVNYLSINKNDIEPSTIIKIEELLTNSDVLMKKQKEIVDVLLDTLDLNDLTHLERIKKIENKEKIVDSISLDCEVRLDTIQNRLKFKIANSNKQMSGSFEKFSNRVFILAAFLFVLIILISSITGFSLVVPLNKIKKVIIAIGNGTLPNFRFKIGTDEIGQMGKAINILIEGLNEKAEFAQEIGKENYDSEFNPLGQEDVLGNSLLTMRDNLAQASEAAELRRIENQQRSWSSQGLAEFSEILRKYSDSLESFSSITISKLTKYLGAQVGGLYMLVDENQEDRHLQLVSFYAYDRQKFIDRRIEIGENLVGQCVLESETIYMTDIPEGYVHISSGLGKDSPKSLLITPLKLNDEIYGVVELASFEEFPDYQIEFVEKIGESIASTIANIKINIQTSKLLDDSNEKSKRLAKQEEETRKNIEELIVAKQEILEREQEEKSQHELIVSDLLSKIKNYENVIKDRESDMDKQKNIYESNLLALNNSVGTIETDFDGRIILTNKNYLKMAGVGFTDITGRYIHEFVDVQLADSDEYKKIWTELKYGKVYSGGCRYVFRDIEKWFYETYTPIKDENGRYYKVLIVSTDIEQIGNAKVEFEQQLEGLKK